MKATTIDAAFLQQLAWGKLAELLPDPFYQCGVCLLYTSDAADE